jgi:hypothetical protein
VADKHSTLGRRTTARSTLMVSAPLTMASVPHVCGSRWAVASGMSP